MTGKATEHLHVNGVEVWTEPSEDRSKSLDNARRTYTCDVEGLKRLYAEDKISLEELEAELQLTLPDPEPWG